MYVIAVYDVEAHRTQKMLKICRRYLNWIQNSVFEGEMTEVKLKELILKCKEVMDLETDSLIIFRNPHANWLEKQVVGREKSSTEQYL